MTEVANVSEQGYLEATRRLEAEARHFATETGLDWDAVMRPGQDRHTPARQALTVLAAGLFDEAFYVSTYPDVLSSGIRPLTHYIRAGDAEGRRPNAVFDPNFYRSQFDSGEPRAVSALYHYAVFGEALGLKASGAFSPRRYLQSNPELQAWLDKPLTHYLQLGRQAGLTIDRRERLTGGQKVIFRRDSLQPVRERIALTEGVNVIGPLDRVSGLGVSARGYLDGLRQAGVAPIGCRVQQREFTIQSSNEAAPAFPTFLPDAPVNVVHMNGDTLQAMIAHGGDEFFRERYNIAVWYWELPTLRPEWQASMKYFQEFWAPTPFIFRMLRQSTAKPVRLLPPYLAYLRGLQRQQANPDETRFVYCFDANSVLERKNPRALLDAFQLAFPKRSTTPAKLILKITYPNRRIAEVDYLYRMAEDDPRITIIDHLLSDADLHQLIRSASAYVSPHRSEGLGLTVIEAMGAGVPVVSTAFGGVDAFVDPATAYSPEYRLAELEDDYPPYPRGFVWADPEVSSLAEQLAAVCRNPREAQRRAGIAQERVLGYFCSSELVERYEGELRRIARP